MPEQVEETVQAILDDPDSTDDEEEAYAIAYDQYEGDASKRAELAKSAPNASVRKMSFNVSTEGSVGAIFKADDDYVIWGPASIEVVDKERDRIKAEALEEALPQLLKRKRLSYEHSDQIVGDILERFETEDPITVKINGNTYERTEFPTDVLKLDGIKPGLYVAGNVYNDTQKAQDVREKIDAGEIDSYSISGEAVVTEMAVKDGQTFTDILKIDLSAVTLCREGMNQKAKFDVVSKYDDSGSSALDPQRAVAIAKSRISKTMSDNNSDDDVEKFVDALDKTLDERLPDGEIATKQDVEEMVDEKFDEKAQEGSPSEGTAERPSGDSDSPTNQSDEYEGDSDEWGDDPSEDSDKVEETKSAGYTTEELKAILPDDQYKAIEPLLNEKGDDMGLGDEEPDVDPRDEDPEEMVEPGMGDEDPMEEYEDEEDEDVDPVMASKAVQNINLNKLSDAQKNRLLKATTLAKAKGDVRTSPGVGGGTSPAHAGSTESDDIVAKADGDAINGDPALRKIYDEDGTPQV